jgi:hypothetical protein
MRIHHRWWYPAYLPCIDTESALLLVVGVHHSSLSVFRTNLGQRVWVPHYVDSHIFSPYTLVNSKGLDPLGMHSPILSKLIKL